MSFRPRKREIDWGNSKESAETGPGPDLGKLGITWHWKRMLLFCKLCFIKQITLQKKMQQMSTLHHIQC